MRILCNDLMKNEFFVLYCDPTDTIGIVKQHFIIHQNLFLSPLELTMDIFYLYDNPFPKTEEIRSTDITCLEGTIEEYAIQENDILLFVYPIEEA